jgi:hypothetical protein
MRLALVAILIAAACSGTAAPVSPDGRKFSSAPREPASAELQSAVRRLTDRSGANTTVSTGANGIRVYHASQGMGEVVVARTNPDGTVTAKCVSSASDGMVSGQSGAQK